MADDTKIHKKAAETSKFDVRFGQRVRISAGALEGLCGTVVGQRADGRIVLKIQDGVLVEIDAYCLQILG